VTTEALTRPSRRSLVDLVIARIQQQISLGVLTPGKRIPTETELGDALGVSRTTIREAVVVLAHMGLLEVRQGDGTYVTTSAPGNESLDQRLRRAAALEVYEVRRPLEIETARLAATRRTEGDVRRLRDLLAERDKLRAAGKSDQAVDTDVEFHRTIAVASKNAVLADVYNAFSIALRKTLVHIAHDSVADVDTTDLHHALVDAIAHGDEEGASAMAARLIETDAERLRSALTL
jgi:GntR family transcriptional regulator, transcriptional repressor for pyruvate dehydrogenase complex